MSRGRKIVQYIAVWMLAIFGLGGFYLKAEAASQQIARLEEAADLTVMFNFDQENVDITFVSPSGARYTKDTAGVEFAEGELWSTYRITGAEAHRNDRPLEAGYRGLYRYQYSGGVLFRDAA